MSEALEASSQEDLSIERIFSLAVQAVRNNSGLILVVALLFGTFPQLLMSYAAAWFEQKGTSGDLLTFAVTVPAAGVTGLAVRVITQAVLTRATVAQSSGSKASFRESIAAAFDVALPLIGFATVTGFGIILGLFIGMVQA